jgi:hypothetical protein
MPFQRNARPRHNVAGFRHAHFYFLQGMVSSDAFFTSAF